MWNRWINISLWKKNLIALVLGIVIGLILKDKIDFLQPIGNAFINLLKMMVIPLIFVTLINSIINIANTRRIFFLSIKMIFLFLITTIIAIILSIIATEFIKPGIGTTFSFPGYSSINEHKTASILDTLLSIIPSNPFKAFVDGNVLQVTFLSIFTSIVLSRLKMDKSQLVNIINILNEVIYGMVNFILQLMPIGIFALMTYSMSMIGIELVVKLSVFVILVCLLCVIQVFIIYPIFLKLTGNTIINFYKGAFKAIFSAFALSSSSAALPVTIECAKKMKINEVIRSFVIPLGSTINMNGSAIQQVVITIFVAQIVGLDLNFYHYCLIMITTLVATIGTAGIPSAGLIMTTVVLNSLGLPVEGIALVAGVDRIIDMITSSVNITGDLLVAKIMSEQENKRAKLYKNNGVI